MHNRMMVNSTDGPVTLMIDHITHFHPVKSSVDHKTEYTRVWIRDRYINVRMSHFDFENELHLATEAL